MTRLCWNRAPSISINYSIWKHFGWKHFDRYSRVLERKIKQEFDGKQSKFASTVAASVLGRAWEIDKKKKRKKVNTTQFSSCFEFTLHERLTAGGIKRSLHFTLGCAAFVKVKLSLLGGENQLYERGDFSPPSSFHLRVLSRAAFLGHRKHINCVRDSAWIMYFWSIKPGDLCLGYCQIMGAKDDPLISAEWAGRGC